MLLQLMVSFLDVIFHIAKTPVHVHRLWEHLDYNDIFCASDTMLLIKFNF